MCIKKNFSIALTVVFLLLVSSAATLSFSAEEGGNPVYAANGDVSKLFDAKTFQTDSGYTLPYRIYIPYNYDSSKAYPLVLFLHGAGERGNDNVSQLKNGIGQPFKKEQSPIYQCIVVAPQCPSGKKWVNVKAWTENQYSTDQIAESDELKAVVELLFAIEQDYSVDTDRIYATGLSMGGYGTWDLLVRHGDLFAAGIPVCGGCDVSKAELLTDIPIRTYHGGRDTTVPPTGTEAMVNAIKQAGGTKINYTCYDKLGHSIWNNVYAIGDLFSWLLAQKLSDRLPEHNQSTDTGTLQDTDPPSDPDTEANTSTQRKGCTGIIKGAPVIFLTATICPVLLHARYKPPHFKKRKI